MPQRVLADWLRPHRLAYAVGGCWHTQLATAPAGRGGGRGPCHPGLRASHPIWLIDTAGFRGGRRAQLAIITPDGEFGIDPATVTATYGCPLRSVEVADDDVAVLKDWPAALRTG